MSPRARLPSIDALGAGSPAIVVSGTRLCMIPFGSNNQSRLSGCHAERLDDDACTFGAASAMIPLFFVVRYVRQTHGLELEEMEG